METREIVVGIHIILLWIHYILQVMYINRLNRRIEQLEVADLTMKELIERDKRIAKGGI